MNHDLVEKREWRKKVSDDLGLLADKCISLGVFASAGSGAISFALPIHTGGEEVESWFASSFT